jgi:hypothetical protein
MEFSGDDSNTYSRRVGELRGSYEDTEGVLGDCDGSWSESDIASIVIVCRLISLYGLSCVFFVFCV